MYDSDFDSDDEEAENKIIECYEHSKSNGLNKLTDKILKKIPHHMKDRLENKKR